MKILWLPCSPPGRRVVTLGAAALLLLAACKPGHPAERTLPGLKRDRQPPIAAPTPVLSNIGDLRSPESVLVDPQQDCYFISNINGAMLDVDNDGFISRVDPNTMKVDLYWIQAGRNGVHLDAPKGMGIVGDTLYVSDISTVRRFNRRTGAPAGEIRIPGSTFLNDITSDGTSVYVSDTGIHLGPGTSFVDTGSDAIWKITGDRAEKIAAGRDLLQHPNGLDFVDGHLRVITFAADALYQLDGGKRTDLAHLPKPQLDGLVHLPNGDVVVTSWEGNQIYRGPLKGPFRAVIAGAAAPADIGYDAKRHHLLVPLPMNNQVTIHPLQ